MRRVVFPLAFLCVAINVGEPFANAAFRAGAARVDITPAKDEALLMAGYAGRKEGHKGIHDNLHVRAVVLDDGTRQAAIVTLDLIGVPHPLWKRVADRAASQAGIAPDYLLLAGTHTHGGPALAPPDDERGPRQAAYIERVEEAIQQALREAKERLQPARAGAAMGQANVNINRRAEMADGTWWLGVNPDGVSDKTVAVVRFDTLAGEPIAIFANYGVHGTGMSQQNYQITADIPGATSRWVEQHYGGGVVALWTSGTGGDQCPIYNVSERRFEGVDTMGRLLGRAIVNVAGGIRAASDAKLRGAQKVVTCPGRKLTPGPTMRRKQYEFVDADPNEIRLSLLMIGDIALAGVSGEVLTPIGLRLKRESRLRHTIMVTHCNGSSGYLPDDASYQQISYEIAVTRVKPGCAENAIVDGLLELMKKK